MDLSAMSFQALFFKFQETWWSAPVTFYLHLTGLRTFPKQKICSYSRPITELCGFGKTQACKLVGRAKWEGWAFLVRQFWSSIIAYLVSFVKSFRTEILEFLLPHFHEFLEQLANRVACEISATPARLGRTIVNIWGMLPERRCCPDAKLLGYIANC